MDYDEIGGWLERSSEGDVAAVALAAEHTLRERFRKTMFFQEVGQRPNFEFGYWDRTLEVWREQGMPDWVVDEATAYDYFGIENWVMLPCNPNPTPICEHEILEETESRLVYRDAFGCVAEVNRHGDRSIPHYLDFPIKDRASWEPFKAALDPEDPQRWIGFEEAAATLDAGVAPVGIYAGSLLGIPRNLIGFEGIAMMAYEDPELLAEIVDTFGACITGVLERALPHAQVDLAMGWEDICFNSGPIVPPAFMRDVAGPWYRRIADLLVAHGCCVYTTDTDGNINPIVGIFLDNGLNTMFPVEVHAGTDPVALRARFGKRIRLWGGVCKMRVAEGKAAIDAELARLRPVVEEGGFIPTMDHRTPANITLKDYQYYIARKREIFNLGGTPKF